jgi:hypothetical protein
MTMHSMSVVTIVAAAQEPLRRSWSHTCHNLNTNINSY